MEFEVEVIASQDNSELLVLSVISSSFAGHS